MQANQCLFTLVCRVRTKGWQIRLPQMRWLKCWKMYAVCKLWGTLEPQSRLCRVADIGAGSTGAGTCVTRLSSWVQHLVAMFLPCSEAPTGSAALRITMLSCFARSSCAPRVFTLQWCTGSAGHISVAFHGLVPTAWVVGVWNSPHQTGVTVLRSCRACLRHLGWLTWFKTKLIQACSFWSSWRTLEQAIRAYKKRCWWPLNPIGKQDLSS